MVACAPWGAAGEFAASRHGVLTRSQAAEHGLSAKVVTRLLRDGELVEPAPSVLVVVGSPRTWSQRLYVATLAAGGVAAAGFRSAAALHGFDGYERRPLELLLPGKRRRYDAEVVHRHGPMGPEHVHDFIEIEGIRCTGVARTLCDLGSVDSPDRVRLAFESAWRAGASLAWMRQTAERLHRPGQRGTGVLLRLIDDAEKAERPTESALEVRVERALRGVPGVVRQFTIRDSSGGFVARVDFAIPELRIAIEAHSRQFHFGKDAHAADAVREVAIQAQGWIIRFVTAAQARNVERLRDEVLALVNARRK